MDTQKIGKIKNQTTVLIKSDQHFLTATSITNGDLHLLYESGRVRYIRLGDVELVRMIYFALRDSKWDTIPYSIENFEFDKGPEAFRIAFLAVYDTPDIKYQAEIEIKGGKDNTIEFSFSGTAGSEFLSNRIGICVHHPVKDFAGTSVSIIESDGKQTSAVVPKTISPHQPFLNLRQLNWNTPDEASVTLKFEGEIFETEDQRNWTDASFKTYCTPLALPYPVLTKKGSVIRQRIILSAEGSRNSTKPQNISPALAKPLPFMGYSRGEGQSRLTGEEIALFKKIPFDVYRVELKLKDASWKKVLEDAIFETKAIGCKLQLMVFFDSFVEEEYTQLLDLSLPAREYLNALVILSANHKTAPADDYAGTYRRFKDALPGVNVGYGTNNYFAELNRNRPNGLPVDFISFSLHPQVHATDNRSILENLESQEDTLHTIASFAESIPIHVSPITLTARFNPDAPHIPLKADNRQFSSFLAWWTLKTLSNLANANTLIFYQLLGDWGLIRKSPAGYEFSATYTLLQEIRSFGAVRIASRADAISEVILENAAGEKMSVTTDMTDPRMA